MLYANNGGFGVALLLLGEMPKYSFFRFCAFRVGEINFFIRRYFERQGSFTVKIGNSQITKTYDIHADQYIAFQELPIHNLQIGDCYSGRKKKVYFEKITFDNLANGIDAGSVIRLKSKCGYRSFRYRGD